MSRPLKCSKSTEVMRQKKVDRISSLPDELLTDILSFLPTKCAVRTSILSPRWRCLHMFTNCLSFECPYVCLNEKKMKAHKKGFKKFVYRVLLLHKVSPIKKFQLKCLEHSYDDKHFHAWISAALSKGVERLHLWCFDQLAVLPHYLFDCQTIVELVIASRFQIRFPESIHLPSLKIFKLLNINSIDTSSFYSFLSACPLLQDLEVELSDWLMNSDDHVRLSSAVLTHLVITRCDGLIEVDAPSLAYLKYRGIRTPRAGLLFKNADDLVMADLYFPIMDDAESIQDALALMKAVYRVKELCLLGNSVQYLTCCEDDQIPSYSNLVKFSLGACSYDTWKYITYWLANSPQLETLIFCQGLVKEATKEEKWPLNVEFVPFSSGVKVIEAYYFHGYTTELVLLRYLLRNAKSLEKLILYTEPGFMTKRQASQMNKKLLLLPRPSSTCVVQMKVKEGEFKYG